MENGTVYLNFVLEKLKERIQKINQLLLEGEQEVEGMHEYYWENYTEMDQYGYENFDNQQALLNQINSNQEQLKLKRRFKKMLDSPYFGCVDFRFEDEDEAESFYIGIGNFAETTGRTPLVYDWRAPVSGLFYDFDKGEASYQAPGGLMEGEITSKWQYKIRNGKMIYEFESDIKIDDDILKAELGANGDVQLKNIIRTIQKEQNAIVRNTKDKILVIQGVAGSGKTSVALHRIAYLLYHDRKNLKSSNILILSPNSVFSDYISHILPELGEENIQEMTFDYFAYQELKDLVYDCEDKYDLIERSMEDAKASELFWEKQSEDFIEQMEGYLMLLEDDLMRFKDVNYRGYHVSANHILKLFYEKFPDTPLMSRMDSVMEYIIDEYETLAGKDLEEEERELFQAKFLSMYQTRDLYELYRDFLERWGYPTIPDVPYEKRYLPYEDVYPLLYLKYRLYRPGPQRNIKHLVIDEMQDYTRLQYMILAKLFPCKMTILGDKAQTMDDKLHDVTKFLPQLLKNEVRTIVMNKSYRNTVEIAQYAASLAQVDDLDLFERHGKPVQELSVTDIDAAIDAALENLNIGKENFETAAILAMNEQDAFSIYQRLKRRFADLPEDDENVELSYINRDSQNFKRGLTVTTFYLAKGLEFDQVFTVYDGKRESSLLKQARYICSTRALHELYMISYALE